jgi:hypothetical protein
VAFLVDLLNEASDTTLASHTPDTGGTWVRHSGSGSATATVNATDDNILGSSGTASAYYYNDAAPASADYSVSANCNKQILNTAGPAGVMGRFDPSALTGYMFRLGHPNIELYRVVGGTFTLLLTGATIAQYQNYLLELSFDGSDIYAKVDGVHLSGSPYTDASPVTAAGYAGVVVRVSGRVADIEAIDAEAGGTTYNLLISDASHDHNADAALLGSLHNLFLADASHAHQADQATLSSGLELSTLDAAHAHTADALALSSTHSLLTADAGHGHSADSLTLSALHNLLTANAEHGHAADAATLTSDEPTGGDPYWDDVALLLHMDGTNGSTTFTDSSQYVRTVSRFGNTQISTAQSKFGGASGLFDGTSDYLAVPASTDWQLGTNDFCIELWVRAAALATNAMLISCRVDATDANLFWFLRLNTTGKLQFTVRTSVAAVPCDIITNETLPTNAWRHVRINRDSGVARIFIDGAIATLTGANTTATYGAAPHALQIGRSSAETATYNGYIDDLRITVGASRGVDSFTPPAEPFPDGPGSTTPTLTVADASHTHTADTLTLSASHTLTTADSSHGHEANVVALAATLNLLIADALHDHLADATTLDTSSALSLTTADSSHGHLVDTLLLTAAHTMLTADSSHAQLADSLTLGSLHNLTTTDASHAHEADLAALSSGIALSVQDSMHGHLADGLSLDTALTLAIADALHEHQADAQLLTAQLNLLIADAVHGHLAGNPTLYLPPIAAELLRKSVFIRLEQLRAVTRVETEQAFARVDNPQVFTRH